MRKLMFFFFLALSLVAGRNAVAGQLPLAFAGSLDFQGMIPNESVDNYYNGGYGSMGSGPGPAWGITLSGFTATGGFFDCMNPPETCAASIGYGAIMNVASGFEKGLSFYYNAGTPGTIELWTATNGTGLLLASVSVSPPTQLWEPFGFFFPGVAQSAVFNTNLDVARLTMGGGMVLPEPGSLMLLATGLSAAALRYKRTRR